MLRRVHKEILKMQICQPICGFIYISLSIKLKVYVYDATSGVSIKRGLP